MFTLADLEHNEILTDKCEIHFFELTKIDRVPDTTDKKKLWMQLINAESEGELDMLAQTNVKEIRDGVNVIRRFSADDKMLEAMRSTGVDEATISRVVSSIRQ